MIERYFRISRRTQVRRLWTFFDFLKRWHFSTLRLDSVVGVFFTLQAQQSRLGCTSDSPPPSIHEPFSRSLCRERRFCRPSFSIIRIKICFDDLEAGDAASGDVHSLIRAQTGRDTSSVARFRPQLGTSGCACRRSRRAPHCSVVGGWT